LNEAARSEEGRSTERNSGPGKYRFLSLGQIWLALAGKDRCPGAKSNKASGEFKMARQLFDIVMGDSGEGPVQMFGTEHIISIAAAGPTLGSETGDYGIWTSSSGPSPLDQDDAPRKKKAA
jgi:hypothetical protein